MPRVDDDDDDRPRRRRRDDDNDDFDDRPRRRPKKSGMSTGLIVGIVLVAMCCLGSPVLIGLLLPAVQKVRQAAERAEAAKAMQDAGFNDGRELVEARVGFRTKLLGQVEPQTPPPPPPPGVFKLVKYDAPNGPTPAYLTPDAKDGKKRSAIVWITGGDCNSIDDGVFTEGPAKNDQSAAAFRKAGVVMMFPSLRGGNNSPGKKEGFLGEIDDVAAAGRFLAKQEYVDPARVYLGGHSTGGTVVLLTAACTDVFRAVFSFGPVDNVSGYGDEYLPFDQTDPKETLLRSPIYWLHAVKVPTFVIEGKTDGNLGALQAMQALNKNPKLTFLPVRGADHFSVLAPVTKLLAAKVLADAGPVCDIRLTEDELARAVR